MTLIASGVNTRPVNRHTEPRRVTLQIEPMEREHLKSTLPKLDQTEDPRGGAVALALLVMGAALIAGIVLALTWAVGAG
ncbi:MAG: hypothetical protein LC721_12425 [Actinobacteria bacterium]|jgi:hypothetical protein|nr:hypothetical protein [Actinomycetota bacterium]